MALNQSLLYLHILSAIIWMGGGTALVFLGIRARQTGDELKVIHQIEWVGVRVGAPSSILMIVTGVWMVIRSPAWDFNQVWIIGAIALFVILFLVGVGFHGPQFKRIHAAVEQFGADSSEVRGLIGRSFLVTRFEVVLFAIALWLMIAKPF
jgi:uncharacterized membrane protein